MRAGAVSTRKHMQKRSMGSAPPPTDGIDGVVRSYFPGDHQLSMAILGGYFGLYLLSKIVGAVSGGGKKPEPVAKAAPASSGDIPSIEDPNFGTWIDQPGNIDKLVNSL